MDGVNEDGDKSLSPFFSLALRRGCRQQKLSMKRAVMWLSPIQAVLPKQRARNAKQMNHKPFLQNIPYIVATANAGSYLSCHSEWQPMNKRAPSYKISKRKSLFENHRTSSECWLWKEAKTEANPQGNKALIWEIFFLLMWTASELFIGCEWLVTL